MDTLNEMKNNVVASTNALMLYMTEMESESNGAVDELNKKNETLNKMNKKLITEIAEKDEKLSNQLQTIMQHEENIKELSNVKEEENKFGMLKAKDKEISNLVKENEHLKKEVEQLKSKIELMNSDNTVECEVTDTVDDTSNDTSNDTVDDTSNDSVDDKEAQDTEEEKVDQPSESESDDDVEYVIKKHKKVKYYVVKGDENSKMYEILDNGDVGDEVGELNNGKKILY
jgi:septal ring factor EnvC (AmiA/AmiB activator)